MHWRGRDYEPLPSSPTETWRRISAQSPGPIHVVDLFPPLGFHKEALLASANPALAKLPAGTPITSCTTVIYVRTGPGRYLLYGLLGRP